jgi:hypothetical protein
MEECLSMTVFWIIKDSSDQWQKTFPMACHGSRKILHALLQQEHQLRTLVVLLLRVFPQSTHPSTHFWTLFCVARRHVRLVDGEDCKSRKSQQISARRCRSMPLQVNNKALRR